jgi:hypothetical protein
VSREKATGRLAVLERRLLGRPTPSSSGDGYLDVLTAHGQSILAATGFALVVLRLYSGAFFDPVIAVYFIAHADTGRILLAFAVLLAPFVAMGLAGFAWVAVRRTRSFLAAAFALLLSLIAAWITPVDYLASLRIVGAAWLIGVAVAWLRSSEKAKVLSQGVRWLGFLGFLYVFLASVTAVPWLPPEIVTLDGEPTPRVAYVVGVSGEWVTLLGTDRTIRLVRQDAIQSRQPCLRGDRAEERTIYQLLNGQFSALPDCP